MLKRLLACVLFTSYVIGPAHADASAAGRLENPRSGQTCSGSLIASDLVLTAAHCIGALRNVEGDTETEVVFRPGGKAGSQTYVASSFIEHPLYKLASVAPRQRLRFDLALFQLRSPVPADVATPLATADEAEVGETLFLISWRPNTPAPPRQRSCRVIGGEPNLVTFACDVRGGESGAPLVRKTETGLELVAVLSSRFKVGEQPVGFAANVARRLPPLLDLIDALDGS